MSHSAHGPDGLPYAFGAFAPEAATCTLGGVAFVIQGGGEAPPDLAVALTLHLEWRARGGSRGRQADGPQPPPITFMRANATVIVSVYNEALAATVEPIVCGDSWGVGGVVIGRAIGDNICVIEGAMQELSILADFLLVCIVLDVAQAFPRFSMHGFGLP